MEDRRSKFTGLLDFITTAKFTCELSHTKQPSREIIPLGNELNQSILLLVESRTRNTRNSHLCFVIYSGVDSEGDRCIDL